MRFEHEYQDQLGQIGSITNRAHAEAFMSRSIFEEMLDDGDAEDRRAVGDLFETVTMMFPPESRAAGGTRT